VTSRRAGTVTVSGINGERIVQKNVPLCFPRWVTRTEVKRQDGTLQQVICDKPATLVYPANQACAEMHAFRRPALPSACELALSSAARPEQDSGGAGGRGVDACVKRAEVLARDHFRTRSPPIASNRQALACAAAAGCMVMPTWHGAAS